MVAFNFNFNYNSLVHSVVAHVCFRFQLPYLSVICVGRILYKINDVFNIRKQNAAIISVLSKYVILNIFVHPPALIGTATCRMAIIS